MKILVLFALVVLAAANRLERQKIIDAVNSANAGWVAAHNQFSDWETEDIKTLLGARIPPHTEQVLAHDLSLPDTFDARQKWGKCIHPIRDQGQCGSCWAFSSSEALSDRFCIAKGVDVILSPQDQVSCDRGNLGCQGGYLPQTWQYLVNTGIVTDSCFPYASGGGAVPSCPNKCKDSEDWNKVKHHAASYAHIASNKIQDELYNNGPAQFAFSVYEDFMNYHSGVYHHVTGRLLGGHAVKGIGWGNEGGKDYWLIANSWGTSWGDHGFFKILRGKNECGIESNVYVGPAK